MDKACEHCSASFRAESPRARFCSAKCRKGAFLKRHETPAPPAERSGTTTERVRTELEAAGRLETWQGAAALALAERIDSSTAVMGFAALVKQLEATMKGALDGAKVAADPVDELRARRDRKYAG